jgi:putative oxidoreductase
MNNHEGIQSLLLMLRAFDDDQKTTGRLVLNMDQLTQSLKREGSSRSVLLRGGLAFLARPSITVWAAIPLRLIVGYGFMEHGFAKLSKGPEVFASILHAIGVPAPHLMAWLTILTELIAGLAVLLGALVPLVSLPMGAILFVAMLTVHLPYGFSSIKLLSVTAGRAQFGPPGYELDLLYLACLSALALGGPGPMAIDNYLRKKWKPRS